MKQDKFFNFQIKKLTENDFQNLVNIEQEIYKEDPNIIQGESLIKDIREEDGLKYSVVLSGEREDKEKRELIGYIVAINEKIDKDNLSICLEDFAIIPEAQRRGLGWKMMEKFIKNLKDEVKKKDKPVFLYMYLRKDSRAFMDKYQKQLEEIGVELVKEATINNYYSDKQGLYRLYELK